MMADQKLKKDIKVQIVVLAVNSMLIVFNLFSIAFGKLGPILPAVLIILNTILIVVSWYAIKQNMNCLGGES